ncbi:unnamed protein product, partial [Tetraodon nigroviridis]
QGWYSISKARYSMGNKQVSALQYASEMEPLIHVHIQRKRQDKQGKKDMAKKAACKESFESAAEAVQHRKKEPNPWQDPLKWFGILVPQSLKQAQSSFTQG